MRDSFLAALFFIGVFLTNFAANATLGNAPDISRTLARCHKIHMEGPSALSMQLRLVNFNNCYQWPRQSSYDWDLIRDLLAQDFKKSTNQDDKDALRKAISEIPSSAPQQRTAEAESSGTAS